MLKVTGLLHSFFDRYVGVIGNAIMTFGLLKIIVNAIDMTLLKRDNCLWRCLKNMQTSAGGGGEGQLTLNCCIRL